MHDHDYCACNTQNLDLERGIIGRTAIVERRNDYYLFIPDMRGTKNLETNVGRV